MNAHDRASEQLPYPQLVKRVEVLEERMRANQWSRIRAFGANRFNAARRADSFRNANARRFVER